MLKDFSNPLPDDSDFIPRWARLPSLERQRVAKAVASCGLPKKRAFGDGRRKSIEAQRRRARLIALVHEGLSKAEIARREGVSRAVIQAKTSASVRIDETCPICGAGYAGYHRAALRMLGRTCEEHRKG